MLHSHCNIWVSLKGKKLRINSFVFTPSGKHTVTGIRLQTVGAWPTMLRLLKEYCAMSATINVSYRGE